MFQTDMTKNVSVATLGKNVIREIKRTMSFLNKITGSTQIEDIRRFRETFYERYGERVMPLAEVLDSELGIGYPVSKENKTVSPLIDDLILPPGENQARMYNITDFQSVLYRKAMDVLIQNGKEIVLTDNDIKNFKEKKDLWHDLPETVSCMVKVLKADENNDLIFFNSIAGVCGANLFARFAHTDGAIETFVKEIIQKEQEINPNVIFAEVAHLPDSRVGNILSRPHLRDYEIVYLANSGLPAGNIITVSDLMISLHQGGIMLHSKRLGKKIVPRLTNAHNYRMTSIPFYRFLCDMQHQNGRSGLFFNWGGIAGELVRRPRVRYGNTILSPAMWTVKVKEMKHLFTLKDGSLIPETTRWREKISLPEKALLHDGDNELYVDFENVMSIKALFSIIKKRHDITLSEFLFETENSVVKDSKGNGYTNEVIVVFHRTQK